MAMLFWKARFVVRSLLVIVLCGMAPGLAGCPQSLGSVDPLSPRADVRITNVATPGGSALAPIVSASQGGTTTGAVAIDFPQVGVDVTVFNGVSLSLTALGVDYLQADGLTSLGLEPLRAPLSQFVQARLVENGFEATTLTVRLSAVSDRLRSFLAGPDGTLGSNDDFRSAVVGVITIVGIDINGRDIRATASLSITARPQAASEGGS